MKETVKEILHTCVVLTEAIDAFSRSELKVTLHQINRGDEGKLAFTGGQETENVLNVVRTHTQCYIKQT